MGHGGKWTDVDTEGALALASLNWRYDKIGLLLGRTADAVGEQIRKSTSNRRRLKRRTNVCVSQAGESWVQLAHWGVSVSSVDRVRSAAGNLLNQHRSKAGNLVVTVQPASGPRTNVLVARLIAEARGDRLPKATRHGGRWRPDDDAVLRTARSVNEAATVLGREPSSVTRRAQKIGSPFQSKLQPFTGRGSVPHGNELWEAANAVVPKRMSEDTREDIIQDILELMIGGFEGTWTEAYKRSKRKHYQAFSQFQTVSLDDYAPGTDDVRLIDRLASDVVHF